MDYREATCPACGLHIAAPFFDGGLQPLATLSWPASAAAAQALPRMPLDFVRCVDCGHVFNTAFDYQQVPYSEKPNLMFKRAATWSRFITEAQRRMLAHLPEQPVVVEMSQLGIAVEAILIEHDGQLIDFHRAPHPYRQ